MNPVYQQIVNDFSRVNQKIAQKARLLVELLSTEFARTRPILLITKDGDDFSARLRNSRFFAKDQLKIATLPHDDRSVMHATAADPLIRMERASTRFSLAAGSLPDLLITTPEILLERIPHAHALQHHAQMLNKGARIDRERLIHELILLGYAKVSQVSDRGTFSVRGSIIDIFSATEKRPIRVDLFGDQIESIKYFDETTQRSIGSVDDIIIGRTREIVLDDESITLAHERLANLADQINYPTTKLNEKLRDIDNHVYFYGIEKLLPAFYESLSSLLELLVNTFSKDALPHIVFDDRESIFGEFDRFHQNIEELYRQATIRGDLVFAPTDYFVSRDDLEKLLEHFSYTDIATFAHDAIALPCQETSDLRASILQASTTKDEEAHLLKPLADRLKALHAQSIATVIAVSSREHEHEMTKLLQPLGINLAHLSALPPSRNGGDIFRAHVHAHTLITKNPLSFGAVFPFLRLALIAPDDIFGKRTKRKDTSGKQKGFATAISDLEIGDLVVHVDHGVGQFKGLVRMGVRGIDNDYILIAYANDEKLYLPTHRINLIKPHGTVSSEGIRLDKLGGTAWTSKKSKVKEAVMAMAQELLALYAKRELVERPPFLAPDAHFVEFESNFEFECTHDQQKAIDDVIADMQKKRPMDRLVCGDVGYGKTEVAMRAAMLAVLSKKQVAILAPTTVLAQQHGITFAERFKNTGASIAVLSRFQKPKEIKQTVMDIANHKVDIVIGTHRLLSPDINFADLGLVVIDEEQRFGIKDKEHLKKMRTKIDILTMSATPIPRTMQMSYFGIRDLSIIETPPMDRRAIETQVTQFDDAVIKEAILREIMRGGQVYFVHNRVQSIDACADYLKSLVPEARIAVGHGQMGEQALEQVMLSFMAHEINVLVCTTIIETGIDVSTANTMFINDADDFGLSQLYQLRGRIGRSKERAFCYLLVKQNTEHLSPIARTRLEILHKFSELGVGFRIAQHDLEIRGAGDLLGKNQHGHMAAVGYDLYADLLRDAVHALKGKSDTDTVDPEVTLPISALISDKYCPDLHERMTFYQRFATADSVEKIDALIFDMEDLYGDAPMEVLALKTSALIKLELARIHALKLDVSMVDNNSFAVGITLSPKTPVDHQKLLQIMNAATSSTMRVTPQHKVLQTIGAASDVMHEAILHAARKAIASVEQLLV